MRTGRWRGGEGATSSEEAVDSVSSVVGSSTAEGEGSSEAVLRRGRRADRTMGATVGRLAAFCNGVGAAMLEGAVRRVVRTTGTRGAELASSGCVRRVLVARSGAGAGFADATPKMSDEVDTASFSAGAESAERATGEAVVAGA